MAGYQSQVCEQYTTVFLTDIIFLSKYVFRYSKDHRKTYAEPLMIKLRATNTFVLVHSKNDMNLNMFTIEAILLK